MDKVEKRFRELLEGKHEKWSNDIYMLSDITMHDIGYLSCVGVIILGKKYAGILHSILGNDKQIEPLVELMYTEESNLKGVIIAGADNYANNLENKMRQMDIPIINSYKDHYMTKAEFNECYCQIIGDHSEEFKKNPSRTPYWSKEVVVNPSTQEILMYSGRSGFLQLSPLR